MSCFSTLGQQIMDQGKVYGVYRRAAFMEINASRDIFHLSDKDSHKWPSRWHQFYPWNIVKKKKGSLQTRPGEQIYNLIRRI